MKLSSYLEPELIFSRVEGEDLSSILNSVMDRIGGLEKDFSPCRAEIESSIEYDLISSGVLLVRAELEGYSDILLSIITTKNKILVDDPLKQDREEISLIFLLISSKLYSSVSLSLLGTINTFISKPNYIKKISNLSSGQKILNFVESNEEVFESDLTAESIYTFIEPINLSDSIEYAMKRFVSASHDVLPVVNLNNEFIGELSKFDIIKLGIPRANKLLGSIDISDSSIGSFTDRFKRRVSLEVGRVCKRDVIVVDRRTSIVKIALLMLRGRYTKIHVVEADKYLGTITASEILLKMIEDSDV